jgi:hypothetical protein
MCPEITNLTCYVGDYNQLLNLFAAAISIGAVLGATVGIIAYIIKQKL